MKSTVLEVACSLDQKHIGAPNFNRLARVYRWMEWLTFGPFLHRCRCAFLASLTQRRRALILGDGDGRFTARLLEVNSAIEIDAVDASEAMLRQLASRSLSTRVYTQVADARTFVPNSRDYDLIATHFFLDCLSDTEVSNLSLRLRHYTCPGAIWIISEFAVPSNMYGHTVARPLISALYLAFAWLTNLRVRRLPNHHLALASSGWSLLSQQKRLGGLLVSEMWGRDPDI